MTNVIKQFIENNIILIETHDWITLWTNWYKSGDDYYIEEFIAVLEYAGINFEEESKEARIHILLNNIKKAFIKLSKDGKGISFKDILLSLNSYLNFTQTEIKQIANVVAFEMGLKQLTGGWVKK